MKQAGIYVNDIYCGILTEDEADYCHLLRKRIEKL